MTASALHFACAAVLVLFAGAALSEGLPNTLAEARAVEHADALPATALYQRTYRLKGGAPGDLLGQEAFDGYSVPGLGHAVRFAYHSQDDAGHDLVTTGMVLVPAGTAPAGGWPIIAWAHGTSGEARECAPSLMRSAQYGHLGLADLLAAGFAIVATDYQGLGTAGVHQWLIKGSQARDVLYAVPAARRAVPELGQRWVADGHSQGGVASWGVAELESQHDDPDFLGAISVSGGGSAREFLAYVDEHPPLTLYLPWLAAGLHERFPDFKPQSLLTPAIMVHYREVISHGCWYSGYVTYKDTPVHGALQPAWRDNPYLKRAAEDGALGRIRVSKPLLVLSGEADHVVPIDGVRATVQQACKAGSRLAFRSYPGLDHTPTMVQSTTEQIAFARARFAGEPFVSDCPTHATP